MSLRHSTLLLVEDNRLLRDALRRYLALHLSVNLVEAASAAQAVAFARRRHPDVVLLDMAMRGEPAAALIGRLRSLLPSTRLVAMTGDDDPAYVDTVVELGVWKCVSKESMGSELEPLLLEALGAENPLSRLIPWQVRASRLVRGRFLDLQERLARDVRWLDVHGPWVGKPRIRLLYAANLVELALVLVIHNHLLG